MINKIIETNRNSYDFFMSTNSFYYFVYYRYLFLHRLFGIFLLTRIVGLKTTYISGAYIQVIRLCAEDISSATFWRLTSPYIPCPYTQYTLYYLRIKFLSNLVLGESLFDNSGLFIWLYIANNRETWLVWRKQPVWWKWLSAK